MAEKTTSLEKIQASSANQHPQGPHFSESYFSEASPYGPGYERSDSLSLLREWWRLVSQHKFLLLMILVIVMPFVVIEAYRKKSLYQATATIEVRRESSILKPTDLIAEDAYDNTKAEAFILKSRPVIERTVTHLNLLQNPFFLDITKKKSVIEAIESLGGAEPQREREKKADRTAILSSLSTEVKTEKPQSPEDLVALATGGAKATPKAGAPQKQVSQTDRYRIGQHAQILLNNIKVEPVRETRLLRLSFTHTDPEIAAFVANGLAQNFIAYNFENKTQHFNDASTWLEDSTRQLKARVEEAEQKLANYSRAHDLIPLDGKENLAVEKLVSLHDQVLRAETDRILKQSLYEEVKQGRVEQLPEAFSDVKTADLNRRLSELAVQASQLGVRFGATHPKMIEIQQQMNTLRQQVGDNRGNLEEKLKADYERAVRDEASLKASFAKAKDEAAEQNQAAIQYNVLQQDYSTAKALYTDFFNKTSQANLQRAEQYNNVRLIEAAEAPSAPVGPNRMVIMLVGLMLTLAFGMGLAWLVDNLNTRVRSSEDVMRAIQMPVLATIPTMSEESLHEIRNGLRIGGTGLRNEDDDPVPMRTSLSPIVLRDLSAADEAYRRLRTSVLLSTAGRPPRTILFASPKSEDGKTTTVINTAIAFTQLKAEVLVIDCDLRKPMIHRLAHLDANKGLSTYLAGGGEISDFIERTQIPYLSVLPSGPEPPNPSELISSSKMKEMLGLLGERYDYILIDSPPLLSVTDPIILSTMVDGVILVAKSGKSKSETLRRVTQDLASVRARVIGVILNAFEDRKGMYDYSYAARARLHFNAQQAADQS